MNGKKKKEVILKHGVDNKNQKQTTGKSGQGFS